MNIRATILLVLSILSTPMTSTLNIAGLIDINAIYDYANILLGALVPIVVLSLGFALARYVVSFVMKIFNNLGS